MTRITTRNPATEETLEVYALETDLELDQKLTRSKAAFHAYSQTSIAERAVGLSRLAGLLRVQAHSLAATITREMGKPIVEARAEIEKCAVQAEYYAEHGPSMLADTPMPTQPVTSYVSYQPLGPILAVMPWNFPFWQVARFAFPILLAGNTVLLKHAPNVLRSALELERIIGEAQLGQDVLLNILAPVDRIAGLIADSRVAAVTLTGSPRAGAAVAAAAGQALKKSVLELGGSDAFIVLADADIERAVAAGVRSRYGNNGQVCLAAKRFLLEHSIAKEFTERFHAQVLALRSGNPADEGTQLGPMARGDLRDELHNQVERSVGAGAVTLCGGRKTVGRGYYYESTILSETRPGMAVFDEETFGPVAALCSVESAAAAVELANTSAYGLSSALWTRDLDRGQKLARQIAAGAVYLNSYSASDPRTPVGGIKMSGYGRELSAIGLKEFTNAQLTWKQ